MPAAMHTKNWGERRVIRLAPVTVLVSAEYHVSLPHRPPTALPHSRDAVVVATSVKETLADIAVNIQIGIYANSVLPEEVDVGEHQTPVTVLASAEARVSLIWQLTALP